MLKGDSEDREMLQQQSFSILQYVKYEIICK